MFFLYFGGSVVAKKIVRIPAENWIEAVEVPIVLYQAITSQKSSQCFATTLGGGWGGGGGSWQGVPAVD